MAEDEAQLSQLESAAARFAAADPSCLLLLEISLDDLVARTHSPEGRTSLGGQNAVSRLVKVIPKLARHSPALKKLWAEEGPEELINLSSETDKNMDTFVLRPLVLLLRIVRNLCAGERTNQDAFLGNVDTIVQLALALGQVSPTLEETSVIQTAIQILGNVAGGGEEHQSAIWRACFPDPFRQLSECPAEAVQGPLCMLLFQCCRESDERRTQLCSATPFLSQLLIAAKKAFSQLASDQAFTPNSAEKDKSVPESVNALLPSSSTLPTSEAPPPLSLFTPPIVSNPQAPLEQANSLSSPHPPPQSPVEASHSHPPQTSSKQDPDPGAPAGGGEWLEYLVDLLCLQHPLLPQTFTALSNGVEEQTASFENLSVENLTLGTGSDSEERGPVARFNEEQATLLRITLKALEARSESDSASPLLFPVPSAAFLLVLTAASAKACAAASSQLPSTSCPPGNDTQTSSKLSDQITSISTHATGLEDNPLREANDSRGGKRADEATEKGKVSNPSKLPPALPTGRPSVDTLGFSLQILATILANWGVKPLASEGGKDVTLALLRRGLVPLCLDMLRALGLPERLRGKGGSEKGGENDQGGSHGSDKRKVSSPTGVSLEPVKLPRPPPPDGGETSGGLSTKSLSRESPNSERNAEPAFSRLPETYPNRSPYLGYRRDIVAVLANGAHRNARVQEAVREGGGLLLVLQQCVVEESSPYLREWALFAVRNLCEGNERNQAEIASLEVQGGANTAETEKMGYRVEVDPESGKPRLVNIAAKGGVQ